MRARPHLTSAVRIRARFLLWLLSWIPLAVTFGADGVVHSAIWTVQILVGIAGLALLDTALVATVKSVGWRQAAPVVWRALRHGDEAQPSP